MSNSEIRININFKEEIKCIHCDKKKLKDGYEHLDEYGDWFCSVSCEQKNKLYRHYF